MIKHYMRIFYAGSIVSDSSEVRVDEKIVPLQPPERSYAIQFFDREEVESNGKILKGDKQNFSPTFYWGTLIHIDEIRRSKPNSVLYQNMEGNGWSRAVRTKFGNVFPLDKEDVVL